MTATAEREPKQEISTITVKAGAFVQMQDEKWFKCSDVNQQLNRRLSKIGLLLADCSYEVGEGAAPADVMTFTLRQFYQNSEIPQKDYTAQGIDEWLFGLERWLNQDRRKKIEAVLRPGIKEFERLHKGE